MKHKISVVIIVKNERGIGETLVSISGQERPLDADTEVLVIDASHPDVLRDIKDSHPEVTWYQFEPKVKNKSSIPEQRNFGIQQASGDIIVFTDASCIPVEGWLKRITQPLLDGEEKITAGVFGTSSVQSRITQSDEGHQKYLTSHATGNLAFMKEVWQTVGGFDESFLYGSDVDFTWRCIDAGYRIRFIENAGVAHDWGSLRDDVRRAFKYGKARAHLFSKHPHRIMEQLKSEAIVIPVYTIWSFGLTLSFIFPFYVFSGLLFIPLFMLRNPQDNPIRKVITTYTYVIGFYYELWSRFRGVK